MMPYHAAPAKDQGWNISVPPSDKRAGKLDLLTIGGISVPGVWLGQLGEFYVGWAPLRKITPEQKEEIAKAIADFNNKELH